MSTRRVVVHTIEILECGLPIHPTLTLSIACSSGTYIRAIARDIGTALKSCAHISELRRTNVGAFDVNDAKPLSFYLSQSETIPHSIPIAQAMGFPIITLPNHSIKALLHGQTVTWPKLDPGFYTVQPKGCHEIVAVLEKSSTTSLVTRLMTLQEFQNHLTATSPRNG
jgi:tRNA pseudouridine55 synthase